jgi:hypothetical protein
VAEVNAPGGVGRVRFWATYEGGRREIGSDADGSNGWQAAWDCQDAPDGTATLSLSAEDALGSVVIGDGGAIPVTIRKDCPDGSYRTAFFANVGLDDAPASSWCKTSGVSYRWGASSPGAGVPGGDNFSARFRGTFWLDAGVYRFRGESDDGVRVWVNRVLLLDGWRERPNGAESFEFTQSVPGGRTEIRLDYYERAGSASVALSWEKFAAAQRRTYVPLVSQSGP